MNTIHPSCFHFSPNRRVRRARRGVSLVVVMLLVSLAMAVSFAVVHTQGTSMRVQQNAVLRVNARQAAQAGMAVALREACKPGWAGADTSFTRNLSQSESFSASFITATTRLSKAIPNMPSIHIE